MPQSLLEMAKDLVMAQIRVSTLSPDDMRQALHHTYNSLAALKAQEDADDSVVAETPPEAPPAPVDWRKSITKHAVACLECGQSFKQLSVRHLQDHDLDARAYRAKYGIPRTQALSAKATTALRKQLVQQSRPWEKAPTYQKAHPAQAQPTGRSGKKRVTTAKA